MKRKINLKFVGLFAMIATLICSLIVGTVFLVSPLTNRLGYQADLAEYYAELKAANAKKIEKALADGNTHLHIWGENGGEHFTLSESGKDVASPVSKSSSGKKLTAAEAFPLTYGTSASSNTVSASKTSVSVSENENIYGDFVTNCHQFWDEVAQQSSKNGGSLETIILNVPLAGKELGDDYVAPDNPDGEEHDYSIPDLGDYIVPEGSKICLDMADMLHGNGQIFVQGGEFILDGASTPNPIMTLDETNGLRVVVGDYPNGVFTMNGGAIADNNDKQGGGVYIGSGCTMTLNNGEIRGNSATDGGGVKLAGATGSNQNSTLYINGGKIINNTASYSGGGIDGNMIIMTAGEISGNRASTGGGVATDYGGLEMSGGSITGNLGGCGVKIYNHGYFTLSGNAIINDNVGGNLSINAGGRIKVVDALGDNTNIDIANTGFVTEDYAKYMTDADGTVKDPTKYFTHNGSTEQVNLDAEGEIWVGNSNNIPNLVAVPTISGGSGFSGTITDLKATAKSTGAAQHITLSSIDNITFGTETTDSKRDNKDFSATNIGTYTFTMVPASGYYWSDDRFTNGGRSTKTVTLEITASDDTTTTVMRPILSAGDGFLSTDITGSNTTGYTVSSKYSGSDKILNLSSRENMIVSSDDATISDTTITVKNYGEYTVTISLPENSVWADGGTDPITISITIDKGDKTPTITSTETDFGTNLVLEGTGEGTLTWEIDAQDTDTGEAEITEADGVYTFVPKKAGTVTIKLTADGGDNFNSASISGTITINKIDQAEPTITSGDNTTFGTNLTLEGTGEGTLSWEIAQAEGDTGEAEITEVDGVYTFVPKKAGTVTVKLTADGGDNYNSNSVTGTITIGRAQVTASFDPESVQFSYLAQEVTVGDYIVVTGLPTGWDFKKDGSGNSIDNIIIVPAEANVGKHEITIKPDDNHCWADGTYGETTVEYEITAPKASDLWSSAVEASLQGNGKRVTFTLPEDWTATSGSFGDSMVLSGYTANGGLEVPVGASILLDLNNFTIDRGLTAALAGGSVITVNGTLTLTDKSENKGGIITGGKDSSNAGGVYVASSGTFTMEDGKISSNTGLLGGGVYVSAGATFTMSGGEISENTATNTAGSGGVYFTGGTFNVSAKPVIKNNKVNTTANNIQIGVSHITVTGALATGAEIWVKGTSSGTVTSGYADKNKDESGNITPPSNFFKSDDSFSVIMDAGGTEAILYNGSVIDVPVLTQGTDFNESGTITQSTYTATAEWNGKTQHISLGTLDTAHITFEASDTNAWDVDNSDLSAKDIGTYTVKLSLPATGYMWSDRTTAAITVTLEITAKGTVAVPEFDPAQKTYSETDESVTVKNYDTDKMTVELFKNDADETMNWTIDNNGQMTIPGGTAANETGYDITFKLKDGYVWADDNTTDDRTVQYKVMRAGIAAPSLDKTSIGYSKDEDQQIKVLPYGVTVVSVSLSGTVLSWTWEAFTETGEEGKTVRGYKITVPKGASVSAGYSVAVAPDSNHVWKDNTGSESRTLSFSITNAKVSAPYFDPPELEYSLSDQTITVSAQFTIISSTWSFDATKNEITVPGGTASATYKNAITIQPLNAYEWEDGGSTAKVFDYTIKSSPSANRWENTVNSSLNDSGNQKIFALTEDWSTTSGSFAGALDLSTAKGFDSNGALVVPTGASVLLDLNGYALNANKGCETIIYVKGGTLEIINNTTAEDSGTGGSLKGATKFCIVVVSGELIIRSGTVSDNGGGVEVKSGAEFTLSGTGSISDNYAKDNDGNAVYADSLGGVSVAGTMTMSGGTVSGNKAGANLAGGITMTGNGILNLTGGSITENDCVYDSSKGESGVGGILLKNTNILNLSGTVTVSDNNVTDSAVGKEDTDYSQSNICLNTDAVINVVGEIGRESRIGISVPKMPYTVALGFAANNENIDPGDYFFDDTFDTDIAIRLKTTVGGVDGDYVRFLTYVDQPSLSNTEFDYKSGTTYSVEVEGLDKNKAQIKEGAQLSGSSIGNYSVVIQLKDDDAYIWRKKSNTDNVDEDGELTLLWVIKLPGYVTVPTVNGSFTYDGTEKSVADILEHYNPNIMTISESGSKGTNAATYTATVSLNDPTYMWNNNKPNEAVTISWTINRKVTLPPVIDELTYSVEWFEVILDGIDLKTLENSNKLVVTKDGVAVTDVWTVGEKDSDNEVRIYVPKGALGNYTLTLIPDSNHCWSTTANDWGEKSVTVSIANRKLQKPNRILQSGASVVYSADEDKYIYFVQSLPLHMTVGFEWSLTGDPTFEYVSSAGPYGAIRIPAGTPVGDENVGKYQILFVPDEGYEWNDGTGKTAYSVNFSVTKAQFPAFSLRGKTSIGISESADIVAGVDNIPDEAIYSWRYNISATGSSGNVATIGYDNNGTKMVVTGVSDGTVEIWLELSNMNNYADAASTHFTVNVSGKTKIPLIKGDTTVKYVYKPGFDADGKVHPVAQTFVFDEESQEILDLYYKPGDPNSILKISNLTQTDAGFYKDGNAVIIYIDSDLYDWDGTPNYIGTDGTRQIRLEWTIEKYTLNIPVVNGKDGGNYYLFNNGASITVQFKDDATNGGKGYNADIMSLGGDTAKSDVGNWNVKITLSDTTNYQWNGQNSAEANVSWSIRTSGRIPLPYVSGTFVYSGSTVNLLTDTVNGLKNYNSAIMQISDGGTTSATNVGTGDYTFTISFKNPDNYEWDTSGNIPAGVTVNTDKTITITWRIERATINALPTFNKEVTYSASSQNVNILNGAGLVASINTNLLELNNNTLTIKGAPANDYTIGMTPDGNHKWSDAVMNQGHLSANTSTYSLILTVKKIVVPFPKLTPDSHAYQGSGYSISYSPTANVSVVCPTGLQLATELGKINVNPGLAVRESGYNVRFTLSDPVNSCWDNNYANSSVDVPFYVTKSDIWDMINDWNRAVTNSLLNNGAPQTFTLRGNWTADSSEKFVTAFGEEGRGFKDGRLYVPAGASIVLNLNGYNINRNLNSVAPNGNVIYVDGSLTIQGSGNITGGKNDRCGGIQVVGTLTMLGGTVTGNIGVSLGGGIFIDSGNFIMGGGSVTNNRSADGDGGGVYLRDGTFKMTGGAISGNNAKRGGGVFMSGGVFDMSVAGEIKNNTAESGAGVFVQGGTYTMTGGTVSGNTATNNGGGVDLSNGKFLMSGGTVTGNRVNGNGNGGGVYVEIGCEMFGVKQNAAVKDNYLGSGNSVKDNVYLKTGTVIDVIGGLTGSKSIGVKVESVPYTFTRGYSSFNTVPVEYYNAPEAYFTSDLANGKVTMNGAEGCINTKYYLVRPELERKEFVYNGQNQNVNPIGFLSTVMNKSGNDGTKNTEKDVNFYSLTIIIRDKNNFAWTDGTDIDLPLPWSITPAPRTVEILGANYVTYGQPLTLSCNGGTTVPNTSTFTWSVTSIGTNGGYAEVEGVPNSVTALLNTVNGKAGKIQVKVVVAATQNYQACEAVKEITVNRATVVKPYVSGTYYYNGRPQSVKIWYENRSLMDIKGDSGFEVNNYTVVVNLLYPDRYEWADGTNGELRLPWSISKGFFDMSNVKWGYDPANPFVYSGDKDYTISLINLPNGINRVYYENNSKNSVGIYVASVTGFDYETANYEAPEFTTRCTWEIKPGTYDLSGIHWNYVRGTTKYVYNASNYTVSLVGTLPAGVTVSYTNNVKTNAGKYKAEATFSYDNANYKMPEIAPCEWEILKADYVIPSNMGWSATREFTYDGLSHSVTVVNLPVGLGSDAKPVTVKRYSDNEAKTANKYTASVLEFDYDTTNYNAPDFSATCEWEIKKAKYTMTGFSWKYYLNDNPNNLTNITSNTVFVYDADQIYNLVLVGSGQPVEANGKVATVKAYTNKIISGKNYTVSATNAGVYYASVAEWDYDTVNYEEPELPEDFSAELSWTINKATYTVTNVSWDYNGGNGPFTYDGSTKEVFVKGTGLNNGFLTVSSYTGNREINATVNSPNAKTVAGKLVYVAQVFFNYDSSNYTLDMGSFSPTLEWVIEQAEPAPAFTIDADTETENGTTYILVKMGQTAAIRDIKTGNPADCTVSWSTTTSAALGLTGELSVSDDNVITPKKVGKVKLTMTVGAMGNYKDGEISVYIKVIKGDLGVVEPLTWSYAEAFGYDGKDKTVDVSTAGLPAGVTLTRSGVFTATNAGAYTAEVSLVWDTENYNTPKVWDATASKYVDFDAEKAAWLKCEWQIAPASLVEPKIVGTYTYTGDTANPITVNWENFNSALMKVTEGIVSAIDADTYTIKVKLTDSNYKWLNKDASERELTLSWTIDKSSVLPTFEYAGGVKFGSNSAEPTIIGKGTPELWEIVNLTGRATIGSDGVIYPEQVGTVRVILTVGETSNYKGGKVGLDIEIQKGDLNLVITNSETVTYGRNLALSYTGNVGGGLVEWAVNPSENEGGAAHIDGNTNSLIPDKFGYVTIILTVAETTNYNGGTANKTVKIEKANYNLSDVDWNYTEAIPYDGQTHTVKLVGLPTGLTAVYSGTYSATAVKSDYVAYVTLINDNPNYNDPELSDTQKELIWGIKMGAFDMSGVSWSYVSGETVFKYDGNEKTVVVNGLPAGLKVKEYHNAAKTVVGHYTATVEFECTDEYNGNYEVPAFDSCEWEIEQGEFVMDGVKWNYTAAIPYDGSEHTVQLTGLPSGLKANYTGNVGTDVNTYKATVSFAYDTTNYKAPEFTAVELSWEITLGNYDLTNVKWNYTTAFTYDGKEHSVELVNLPDGLTVTYENATKIDADTYTATVTGFVNSQSANYNTPKLEDFALKTLEWTINKAGYTLGGVKWNYTAAFTYDGKEHSVELVNLPDGLTVTYENATKTDADTYTATVTGFVNSQSANYNTPKVEDFALKTLEWTINKADYSKLANVKWDYTTPFTYQEDGDGWTVQLLGVEELLELLGGRIEYTGANGKNANVYKATAKLVGQTNTNYNTPVFKDCTWIINRADYNMDNVRWTSNVKFTFDGMVKSVELVAESLPAGVTVREYSGNSAKTPGLYTARVVSFNYEDTENYNAPVYTQTRSWEIEKAIINAANVEWSIDGGEQYTFDGTDRAPKAYYTYLGVRYELPVALIRNGNSVDEAVDAGTYVATALGGENFELVGGSRAAGGSGSVSFTVAKARIAANKVTWTEESLTEGEQPVIKATVNIGGKDYGLNVSYSQYGSEVTEWTAGDYLATATAGADSNFELIGEATHSFSIIKTDEGLGNLWWIILVVANVVVAGIIVLVVVLAIKKKKKTTTLIYDGVDDDGGFYDDLD